jgi:hypothetical protein
MSGMFDPCRENDGVGVYMKPTSNQTECDDWQDCSKFFVLIVNADTIDYEDIEMRIYFSNPNLGVKGGMQKQCWDGGTQRLLCEIEFGSPQEDGLGGWYLPIGISASLEVGGQMIFDFRFLDDVWMPSITYKDLVDSWSLRPHTSSSDPEYFEGIDLTKGPLYTGLETTWIEKDANGNNEVAYTKNPYITLHAHGKTLYGYAPDDTP